MGLWQRLFRDRSGTSDASTSYAEVPMGDDDGDRQLFTTRLRDHLARIDALGGPYSVFIHDHFTGDVIEMLGAAASSKMVLTSADLKEHSFCVSMAPVSCWICTLALSIDDAKGWFAGTYGGYSKLLERAWSSDHFRTLGCEVLVHIVYGRTKQGAWVNMTIFPVGSNPKRFGMRAILPIDLLTEAEKVV